jgi:hypothetical protein
MQTVIVATGKSIGKGRAGLLLLLLLFFFFFFFF